MLYNYTRMDGEIKLVLGNAIRHLDPAVQKQFS